MRRGLALLLVASAWFGAAVSVAPVARAEVPLGTYVVTFATPPTAEDLDVLAGVARSVHAFEHVPAAVVVVDLLDVPLLAHLPGVLGVTPNRSLDPQLRQSTRTIRADRVWDDLGVTGDGIGVAVIDTGVDGTHPDLCAAAEFCQGTPVKTVQNVKFVGRQDVAVDPVVVLEDQINTDTSSGHGTHVSGIAAGLGVASAHEPGKYRGVAWGADLIGLGTGEALETVNVLAAYDWVIENKDDPRYNIKVVNNSYGPEKGTPFDPTDPVQRAIDAAHDAGLTVVFSAGNSGPATDSLNAFSVNPDAVSVAAGIKEGHVAVFSSRGVPGSDLWHPTITAPGQAIASARASTGFVTDVTDTPNPDLILPPDNARYATGSGTSMAAPHIAGMVALMQEAAFDARGAYLTPDEVKAIIQNTAVSRDPSRGPGGLPSYQGYTMGAGYADAFAAVQAAAAGTHVQPYDDGVTYDVRGFTGTVGPAVLTPLQSFETTYDVAPGALSFDVMIDWSLAANDLEIDLFRPDGTQHSTTHLRFDPAAEPNGYSSTFTNVPNERTAVVAPEPGTWRAVVRGSLSATDTVNGLWSAAYDDGAAPPPAQAPATLTLAPAAATSLTGVDVDLVATVRDAGGNPVPNVPVTWTTAGAGALPLAEATTNAAGIARATARSSAPGTQQVVASDGTRSSTATITWLGVEVPPLPGPGGGTSTPAKVSGGGWFDDPGRRTFAVSATYHAGATAPGGHLTYDDGVGTAVRSEAVTRVVRDGARAVIYGRATRNGQSGYQYQVEVVDNGEPGRNDTFRLTLTKTTDLLFRYETQGTLRGGNVQVRAA
jgi:serine protease AprX